MYRYLFFSLILMLLIGCLPKQEPTSILNVASGHVERIHNVSSGYVSSRSVDVWLPDGYNGKKRFPVLYMHDGQMLFDASTTWNKQEWKVDEVLTQLIKNKEIDPFIVVGIHNVAEDRHSDYFPQKPWESLSQGFRNSLINYTKKGHGPKLTKTVNSDNYLKFLVEEVKPLIDDRYRTKQEKENTFIAGSSMGGLISMYAICEYPEIFAGAICMSTHWIGAPAENSKLIPDSFVDYLEKNLPDPKSHKMYFDYGTETLDSLYEPFQLRVDKVIERKGYTSEYWMTFKAEGAAHTENAWSDRLDIPFKFMLKN